jgi:hypothetical protein
VASSAPGGRTPALARMWSVCYILERPFQFCNADTDVGVRSGPLEG